MSPAYELLEDGTRVYKGGARYKPKAPEERLIGVNKPDDPRALRFHGRWFLPLPLVDDRVMPETRPDEDAYWHMYESALCMCDVCRRPAAERWRRRWRRHQGLG